ncbi:MAG: hypothetical protein RIT24_1710 [Planctomycetota bacterium]|jgi:hypothetical protein
MFAIFMVQTQRYRAPTYNTFRRLLNEAAGVASRGGGLDGPLGDQPAGEDARPGDAPQPRSPAAASGTPSTGSIRTATARYRRIDTPRRR